MKLIHIFYVLREVYVQFLRFMRILFFSKKMSAFRSENSLAILYRVRGRGGAINVVCTWLINLYFTVFRVSSPSPSNRLKTAKLRDSVTYCVWVTQFIFQVLVSKVAGVLRPRVLSSKQSLSANINSYYNTV